MMHRTAPATGVGLGGVTAVAGGLCWVAFASLAALSPPYGTAGNYENLFLAEDAWLLAALPLLAVGAWALDRAVGAWASDRAERQAVARTGRVGAGLFVAGALIASASLASEVLGVVVMDRPLFEIGARVLFIPSGGLLLGWASLRGKVIPVPFASLLLAGTVLLFIANSENWMAGLAAAFGLAWIVIGAALVLGWARGPVAATAGPETQRRAKRAGRHRLR